MATGLPRRPQAAAAAAADADTGFFLYYILVRGRLHVRFSIRMPWLPILFAHKLCTESYGDSYADLDTCRRPLMAHNDQGCQMTCLFPGTLRFSQRPKPAGARGLKSVVWQKFRVNVMYSTPV
jgi:hypothetical protein